MLSLIFAALLSVAPASTSAVINPLETSVERRNEIAAVEASFTEATKVKDAAALKSLMGSDFVLTGDDMPGPLPGATWLANLQRMTLHSYTTRVVDVRSYGNLVIATVEGDWE